MAWQFERELNNNTREYTYPELTHHTRTTEIERKKKTLRRHSVNPIWHRRPEMRWKSDQNEYCAIEGVTFGIRDRDQPLTGVVCVWVIFLLYHFVSSLASA